MKDIAKMWIGIASMWGCWFLAVSVSPWFYVGWLASVLVLSFYMIKIWKEYKQL